MQRRHVALSWVVPLFCFLALGGFSTMWGGCGAECTAPQIKKGDTCVDPAKDSGDEVAPDTGKEAAPEVRPEPRSEPKPVDAGEVVTDTPAERKAESNQETVSPDVREATPEQPPKERIPELPPEPSGPEPTVLIKAPKEGELVKGNITIMVEATVASGAAIAEVILYVDEIELQKWTKPPFEYPYSTTSLKDGVHKLKAVARTTLGKVKQHEISFTTSNSGPQIAFVTPTANDTVSAAFTVEVTVTSAQGIKAGSVTLEIDGAPVVWTQTTPTYKATFDPVGKAFDSLPISVSAEDTQGAKETKELWVVHEPAPGPKKNAEECDNADPLKRCIAGHSCLLIGGASAKASCYKHCVVGGASSQCPVLFGKQYTCQVAFQGTTRGACVEGPPQPGSAYSPCGMINGKQVNCNTGLVCVGAQRRPDNSLISFCLRPCPTPGSACTGDPGFTCVGLTGGGGACIEQCGQKCVAATDCSKGQKCTNNACSAPFCPNYGSCIAIQGLASRVCI